MLTGGPTSGGMPAAPSPGRLGTLEVRLARTPAEVRQAQRLRYRVFFKEGGASPASRPRLARRDIDAFDRLCDHLLVIDHAAPTQACAGRPTVVGTYRLLRQDVAERHGGFYSAGEFDDRRADRAPLRSALSRARPLLRAGALSQQAHVELLWHGIAGYAAAGTGST